jgi:chromate transporter
VSEAAHPHDPSGISPAQAQRVWAGIGFRSFGGPTAQIALLHRVLVAERGWLSEREFLDALGFCMLLPGPEAMQLATYAGWKLHGTRGGLAAGLWFVVPGALVVLALAVVYTVFGHLPWTVAAFAGIKAAVLVLVVEAMIRIGRRALTDRTQAAIAIATWIALGAFGVPYPVVVAAAGAIGWFRARNHIADVATVAAPVPIRSTIATIATWALIWASPLLGVAAAFGPAHILSQLGWFFSKLAMVTFGGAYAVLGYMAQDVVTRFGWLTAGQMLDGLGLAETTPGPLILVTEFVGFVAAQRAHPEAGLAFGFIGAAIAVWATFAPCFLWIFAGAPHLARIRSLPRLRGALTAITAAVLGVMASLSMWFALHVLFHEVADVRLGPAHVLLPRLPSLDWTMLLFTAISALLLRLRWSVHAVLIAVAALSVALAWSTRLR